MKKNKSPKLKCDVSNESGDVSVERNRKDIHLEVQTEVSIPKSLPDTPLSYQISPNFKELLHTQITDKFMVDTLHSMLLADRPILNRGQVVGEYPDHAVRLKAWQLAATCKGYLQVDPLQGDEPPAITITLTKS